MNNRTKELAEQAGIHLDEFYEINDVVIYDVEPDQIERFAELIRQDEREALIEAFEKKIWEYEYRGIVETIRARGNT